MLKKTPTFEFTIVASGLDPEAEDFFDRFYEAGCDDATVAFQNGHIILDFTREAATLEEAIASAVADVARSGARAERVEPDPLVSLSDMAARAGLSRAAMTNYFKGLRAENFPPPVARVTTESPLWEWATVARWMYRNRKLTREAALAAAIVRQANAVISDGGGDIARRLKNKAREVEKELDAA